MVLRAHAADGQSGAVGRWPCSGVRCRQTAAADDVMAHCRCRWDGGWRACGSVRGVCRRGLPGKALRLTS